MVASPASDWKHPWNCQNTQPFEQARATCESQRNLLPPNKVTEMPANVCWKHPCPSEDGAAARSHCTLAEAGKASCSIGASCAAEASSL